MKIGDVVTIGGKKFNVRFVWENYIIVSMTTADLDTLASSTLVFKIVDDKKLKLVEDKEEIKVVVTKLFEIIQGKKSTEDTNQ